VQPNSGNLHRIIFSDVDGTLLDREGRIPANWEAVLEATSDALFVLTSSRTVEELLYVQQRLGLTGPFIAENGAVVVLTEEWIEAGTGNLLSIDGRVLRQMRLGTPALQLQPVIRGAAEASGVTIEEQQGGGSAPLASPSPREPAPGRTHSVLLRLKGQGDSEARFRAALAAAHLTVSHSGRWIVVQGGTSKGTAVLQVRHHIARQTGREWLSIGVGDAENDRPLLEATHLRFVVRRPDGVIDPALHGIHGAVAPVAAGINGWGEIVHLMNQATDVEAAS
jgi:mannosyl-3-phosphoglycerate phosphatase